MENKNLSKCNALPLIDNVEDMTPECKAELSNGCEEHENV